ncbi:MAG: N-formylglutamate amidohydrolase, partial [Pseudomonadota bacterium]|nr:N-formylglutamate amidohydrolase [Pseudomonadota bacterium]
RYPGVGCAIALEFKKFFMDEWTGEPDPAELRAMREFITFSGRIASELLNR